MSFLHVQWNVKPLVPPQPRLNCSGCAAMRPFKTTDKIRLNANGKLLDAWLIYRCTQCSKTWNRPIFERRNIREIDPTLLYSLQNNDPDWIKSFAFDIGRLWDIASKVDEFTQSEIQKIIISRPDKYSGELMISLHVLFTTSLRCDRFLASELKISRLRLEALHRIGSISASDQQFNIRRAIRNNMIIKLDLSNEVDCLAITNIATGEKP